MTLLRRRTLLLGGIPLIASAAILIYVIGFSSGFRAGVTVTTSVKAKVYLNGVYKGMTPYEATDLETTTQTLTLVAEDSQLLPYEVALPLTPQVKTIVRHKFSQKTYLTSTEIISFQKKVNSEASITVVTKPADSEVSLDGNSPKKLPVRFVTTPGVHTIAIKRDDFEVKNVDIQAQSGYDLTVYVELSALSSPSPVSVRSEETSFAVIKKAPGSKVQVYESPNLYAKEVGQIASGKQVEVLDRDEKNLFIKIYSQEISGWIQEKYSSPSASIQ